MTLRSDARGFYLTSHTDLLYLCLKHRQMKIKEIKANPENPRVIKDAAFEKLCNSIKDFPKMMALRPMVVDADGVVLGGNMRLRALQHLGYKEIPDEWVKRADDLTPEEQKRFIIADNVPAGEWDWDMLANEWDAVQLDEWGLNVPVFDIDEIDGMEDGEEIEIPQSVQIEPPREYVLIMADPNSEEWEELKLLLKLKMVRRGGYKKGSTFDAVALERVIEYNDFKERIKNVNSDTE